MPTLKSRLRYHPTPDLPADSLVIADLAFFTSFHGDVAISLHVGPSGVLVTRMDPSPNPRATSAARRSHRQCLPEEAALEIIPLLDRLINVPEKRSDRNLLDGAVICGAVTSGSGFWESDAHAGYLIEGDRLRELARLLVPLVARFGETDVERDAVAIISYYFNLTHGYGGKKNQ